MIKLWGNWTEILFNVGTWLRNIIFSIVYFYLFSFIAIWNSLYFSCYGFKDSFEYSNKNRWYRYKFCLMPCSSRNLVYRGQIWYTNLDLRYVIKIFCARSLFAIVSLIKAILNFSKGNTIYFFLFLLLISHNFFSSGKTLLF